mgnify:FL=1|jgi:hypothetical protein
MFKVTICDLKNKDRNMADNIEHQDKGELVANCDRFYSYRLKASCATNGYFYKLYAPLQANCPQAADDFKLLFLIPWDHHRRIIDKCKGNGATDNPRPFNAHLHAYVVYKKIYGMQAAVVLNLMHKGKDLLAFMK